ncbi:TldD/PmbA family protein [Oxyplasma meridianum]|uniref:TldD/PmbA family protein n=1 Tax=Oxyplasma meridianum TaxID=3073602 RepID=A0AAX4NJ18_9ARCH
MPGELIDRIMDYAQSRSSFAEARFMDIRNNRVSYRNGEFDGISSSHELGYAVRVVNRSIGMAYFNDDSWDTAKENIDVAVRRSMVEGKNRIFTGKPIKDRWKSDQIKKIQDMPMEEKIAIVRDYDRIMERFEAKIRINVVADRNIRSHYLNSVGSDIKGDISRVFYFYLMGVTENGEFEQSTEEYGSTSGYEYLDTLHLPERIENDAESLKQSSLAPRITPGKFDVIVGPEISGIVAHESCGHPTEYDRIIGREGALAGESFLTGKKFPYRIGSDVVSVIDDPSLKGSFGYYKYDDEGIPSRKRYLYRKGYTDEFILNRESSAVLGVESNAGGRSSSWDMEPLARMSTTYIEPGDHSFEELFEGVRRGVYIKSFTEWNIDDIRFNEKYVGKEAYLIQNGDLVGRVRRPVLETNTVKFYSSIDAVGDDLQFNAGMCGKGDPEQGVDVWMGGPHVRLRDMYVQ